MGFSDLTGGLSLLNIVELGQLFDVSLSSPTNGQVLTYDSASGLWINADSSGGGSVQSVTGLNTDNADPANPVVKISVDGVTITGTGTPIDPLVSISGGSGTVTTTGSPASGNLTKFSGSTSITDGDLSGDVTTSGTLATTLATVNSNVGTFGDASHVAQVTENGKGLTTAVSNVAIQIAESQVTNLVSDLAAKQSTALTNTHFLVGNVSDVATDVAMSGDATLANTGAITLATVNANTGSFGSSTSIPNFTVNGKGLLTAAGGNAVIAPAGTLTGNTLAAGVVTSSLTTVGTIGTGVWQGTKVGLAYGGTNADLSATGGTSQVLKQTSSGAAITVAQLAASDLSNGTTGSGGGVVLATGPTMSNPVVGTQTSSDNSTKAASTAYVTTAVTNALNGLDWKPAVGYATTANVVGTNVAGVFTYTATGTNVIDGHTLALNDVVLFKNQTTGADNGIWVVTTAGAIGVAGVLTRRSDYNTAAEIHAGDTFFVQNGTTNGGTSWVQTSVVTTINSDPLTFSQVSGPGTYVAGTGLTLTGNSFSVNASQTQITAVGTLTGGATGAGFTVALGTSTITGILGSANGGTANGFTKFSGPASSEKTFTVPNASATILTDNALVTAAQGGTANGFTAFSGPATSTKTFTLPNASSAVLTDNAAVTVAQGGTGIASGTSGGVPYYSGSTTIASSAQLTSNAIVKGGGAGNAPVASGVSIDSNNNISGYGALINAQTGTTYTLAASDTGKVVEVSNASAITVTLPNSLAQGFECAVVQTGAGQITVSAAAGATLHNRSGFTKTAGQWGVLSLYATSNSGGTSAVYVMAGDGA